MYVCGGSKSCNVVSKLLKIIWLNLLILQMKILKPEKLSNFPKVMQLVMIIDFYHFSA